MVKNQAWYQRNKKGLIAFAEFGAKEFATGDNLLVESFLCFFSSINEKNKSFEVSYQAEIVGPLVEELSSKYDELFNKLGSGKKFQNAKTLEERAKIFYSKKYKRKAKEAYDNVLPTIDSVSKKLKAFKHKKIIAHKYLLENLLGKGGQAEVHRAKNMALNKDIALKILSEELSSTPASIEEIKNEYQRAVDKLVHPAIVQYRDIDFCDRENKWFIAMDYVDGHTLRSDILQRKGKSGFDIKDIYEILYPIAEALDYAHSNGIVHADLKPENILRSKLNRSYLADFGLSREIQQTLSANSIQMSPIKGTCEYMSPEQCRGKSLKPSTDIWSLSVMVYEMLKLERPFNGRNSLDTMRLISEKEPEPIESFANWDILKHGLEKNPRNRIQSARKFLNLLHSGKSNEISVNQNSEQQDVEQEETSPLDLAEMYYNSRKYKKAFKIFTEHENEAFSCYYLAKMYMNGYGVPKDQAKAVESYKKGGELDDYDCLEEMGDLHFEGGVLDQDYTKALKYYQKAAELDSTSSMRKIGKIYQSGNGVERNFDTALGWYNKAVEHGDFAAYCDIGKMHELGFGFSICHKEALHYYNLAADKKTEGILETARVYLEGEGTVKKNIPTAINHLKKAAELNCPKALKQLASIYLDKSHHKHYDKSAAVLAYEQAASIPDIDSMKLLSKFYMQELLEVFEEPHSLLKSTYSDTFLEATEEVMRRQNLIADSIEVIDKDKLRLQEQFFDKGMLWLIKAADHYDTEAMTTLGKINEGMGDFKEAEHWYEKAASYNNADAAMLLADLYLSSTGEDEYAEKAIVNYKKAAEQGIYEAAHRLAEMYHDEEHIQQNIAEAKKWYLYSLEGEVSKLEDYDEHAIDTYEKIASLYLTIDIEMDDEDNYVLRTNAPNISKKQLKEGLKWYKKSLQAGNHEINYKLARLYKEAIVNDNAYEVALGHYNEYLTNDEAFRSSSAYSEIGEIYEERGNIKEAVSYYQKAEDYEKLAHMHHYGYGVKKNISKALEYYAECHSLQSILGRSKAYFDIHGEITDESKECLQEAIEFYNYNEEAYLEIARMYEDGDGLPQSYSEALSYYKKAAENDNITAHHHLVRMYKEGIGTKVNQELAEYHKRCIEELEGESDDFLSGELDEELDDFLDESCW